MVTRNDLETITTSAERLGLCGTSHSFNVIPSSLIPPIIKEFEMTVFEYPDLALEAVYLELQCRLRELGRLAGVTGNCKDTRQLLQRLKKNRTLSEDEYLILLALVKLLQKAINGAPVDKAAAEWAAITAPKLLTGLEAHLVPPDLSTFGL